MFSDPVLLLAIVASLCAILQHEVIVLSLADSPSSIFGASSIRVLVLAWGFGREGVGQICDKNIFEYTEYSRC